MPISVIIADDHPIVRSGIKNAVRDAKGEINFVAEASCGEEALNLCEIHKPDILLLDINMPGLKSVQVLRALQETKSRTRAVILTAYCDPENVSGMMKAGAAGYLLKEEEPETIQQAIRAIHAGRTWLSPLAMTALVEGLSEPPDASRLDTLSEREQEVLKLLAEGYSNPQIAEKLVIAEGTVKNHITNIYDKIGVHSRAEAVAWAWKHNLKE
jgi:DNA-binding NarL/FixJ family response regulator